eukprot:GILJ01000610.1.p1 GENE.GILJ01000610.1~~GILJ01000610.1.p1  ORF type:complete len:267 (+),score=39.88 GILJ01000610.1:48-803(+)
MKFVEVPSLAYVSSMLDGLDLGDRKLYGRLELYACRKTTTDRRLSLTVEQHLDEELASSPKGHSPSPLGLLSDNSTKKLLINLISTLNESFPDYDFSNLRPEQFTREANINFVINSINTNLAEVVEKMNGGFIEQLWSAVGEVINLRDVEVYSYIPDMVSDPFSESAGILWSLDYFFYDKKQKKILFFTMMTKSKSAAMYGSDGDDNTSSDDDLSQDGQRSRRKERELDDGEMMFLDDDDQEFSDDDFMRD